MSITAGCSVYLDKRMYVSDVPAQTCLEDAVSLLQVAEKFYHYGMALQQVANFHNTMANHLLECHKPCLLEAAKAFEGICLRPVDGQGRAITWSTGAALDAYMSRLQVCHGTVIKPQEASASTSRNVGGRYVSAFKTTVQSCCMALACLQMLALSCVIGGVQPSHDQHCR